MNMTYYKPLGSYIFRIPLFPVRMLEQFRFDNELFDEAVFVASPELYGEYTKNASHSEKMRKTLYKYWCRICTRCTPFGLFASCSIGNVGNSTSHIVVEPHSAERNSRLDMTYLCALVQYLEKQPDVRKKLLYHPNNSLYKLGNGYRYVEYIYHENRREHYLQEIKSSKALEMILKLSQCGITIAQIVDALSSAGYDTDVAKSYAMDLIDNQVLISDISPNITGNDALHVLIDKLLKKNISRQRLNGLVRIQAILNRLDVNLTPERCLYDQLLSAIREYPVPFNPKYILQVDSYRAAYQATVSKTTVAEIETALSKLLQINICCNSGMRTQLDEFALQFSKRFENEEIPLLVALDSEMGIQYPGNMKESFGFLPRTLKPKDKTLYLSYYEQIILGKYLRHISEFGKCEEIIIDEDDFDETISTPYNLPQTISVIAQFKQNGVICLESAGGATAASLIGRFVYLNEGINQLMKRVCDEDAKCRDNDCVVGEIVHLPESRVGNVTSRKHYRSCEICYLTESGDSCACRVPVSDLMVRVINDEIILRSKKLGKRIIPKLSNAHNYAQDPTPIYRFLCDLQYYHTVSPCIVDMNRMLDLCCYVPRVRYGNCYFSLRKWKIKYDDIFKKDVSCEKDALSTISDFIIRMNIPWIVMIKEGDNKLYISFDNDTGRFVFYDIIRHKRTIVIEEYISPDNSVCDIHGDIYNAEYIIPFKLGI